MARAFETRSLDSAELQRYVALHLSRGSNPGGHVSWDLETLTLAAYYFNPDLDAARARSATSEAVTKTAAQRPNPFFQLPFEYTTNPRLDESSFLLGLGIDIPIETAGKRGYRIDQARKLSMAARLNIGNVAWQVRSRVRTQLLDMYAARHRAEVVAHQVTAQQAVAQMLEKRLSVGAASLPEVSLARLALGPSEHLLVGCSGDAIVAGFKAKTVIMDAGNGTILRTIPEVGGSNYVAYNPGDKRFYLGARDTTADGTKATKKTPVLGIIDAVSMSFVENVAAAPNCKAVAVDPTTNQIYMPLTASTSGAGIGVFSR